MEIGLFDYDLPEDRIAQEPLPERDASRLLVLDRNVSSISHRTFRDLPDFLAAEDLLVVNRSKVFKARLLGLKPSGGVAEALLLREGRSPDVWEALVRPGRRLRVGEKIVIGEDAALVVTIASESFGADGRRIVRLEPRTGGVPEAIARCGHTPLPPYIARPDRPEDKDRYQTVYAREEGSIAAPTAGLHFTPSLLKTLDKKGVRRAEVVLHVGPGTFKPVKAQRAEDHRVDPERVVVPEETARAIAETKSRGGRVFAVGTTTVRALEAAARETGVVRALSGETDCVIVPGFHFRVTDALLTNFHLPRSSLLLLVSAFGGRERVLAAYETAIREGYRFYSYGDAMLLL